MAESTSAANHSTECQYMTVGEAKNLIIINYVLATLATAACLFNIVLILVLRAYRRYMHRLTLYLAICSVLFAVSYILQVVPVDTERSDDKLVTLKDGWKETCVAIGFIVLYVGISNAIAVFWISFYVFMFAVFNVQLQKRKYEIAGIVVTVFLPSLFSFVPFIHNMYGLTGTWCWVKDSCNNSTTGPELGVVFQVGLFLGPGAILCILSLLSIAAVVVLLGKRALKHNSYLQQQHWIALKEVLPLLIYPTLFCFATVVDIARSIYSFAAGAMESKHQIANRMAIVGFTADALFQISMISILLSFLLHRRIWTQLATWCRSKKQHQETMVTTVGRTDIPTVQTSRTCYVVAPDSLCSESDPLIIK